MQHITLLCWYIPQHLISLISIPWMLPCCTQQAWWFSLPDYKYKVKRRKGWKLITWSFSIHCVVLLSCRSFKSYLIRTFVAYTFNVYRMQDPPFGEILCMLRVLVISLKCQDFEAVELGQVSVLWILSARYSTRMSSIFATVRALLQTMDHSKRIFFKHDDVLRLER